MDKKEIARELVLQKALDQKGIRESPPGTNRTKFGAWYGMDGVPWCAIGVSWVFHHADQEEIPKFAYTPLFFEWFKDNARAFTKPEKAMRGDIVFFDFAPRQRIQHVEFILRNLGGGFLQCLGFNTSSGTAGSQDDGGGVFVRTRPYGDVVGIGRPPYGANLDVPEFIFPSKAWFGRGDSGADVKTWQKDLNRWMAHLRQHHSPPFNFRIDEDGKFDDRTASATKTFQNMAKLDVDGRVGKRTLLVMERIRGEQRQHDH